MALPLSNSSEGGSNATSVTTGNSGGASGDAWNTVVSSGSFPTFSSTNPAHGTGLGYRFETANPVVPLYVQWDTSLGTLLTDQRLAGRFYYKAPSIPTSSVRMLTFLNGNTFLCGIFHASGTGQIGIRLSNDASGNLSAVGITNDLHRFEFDFQGIGGGASAGKGTVRIFVGDDTTEIDSVTQVASNFGSLAPDRARFGITTANATVVASYYMDEMELYIPTPVIIPSYSQFPKFVLRKASS